LFLLPDRVLEHLGIFLLGKAVGAARDLLALVAIAHSDAARVALIHATPSSICTASVTPGHRVPSMMLRNACVKGVKRPSFLMSIWIISPSGSRSQQRETGIFGDVHWHPPVSAEAW
jgi:hypothetical protein